MMLKEINYKITTDHTLLNKEHGITPELLGKLEGYHRLAVGGKRSSVKKLRDAIERYPKNPILKNYLSVLYNLLGEQEKAYEVNRIMMREHPNYLFGKLNLANEYYFKEQYDKMPEILGNEMELQALFPNRDTFHLNEVLSFYKCTVLYFCAIDDLDQAEIRYELMKELDPDAEDTDIAFRQLFSARMQAGQKRYEEELKTKTLVKSKKQEIFDITHPPKFHHEEIKWLYTNGLHISEEKLNAILSLPRTTLIEDLERVLQDSIDRFGYFQNLIEANEWNEETMNFLVHAMFLLGELKASESRAAVLTILGQSYEFSELYFGDFISILWEPFFKIFSDDLETCLDFMKRPGVVASQRSVITDMVEQVAWHFPERREEVIQWYGEVMQFYLQQDAADNVIDSDTIGLLICNVIDIQGVELSLLIEQLFRQGLVSKDICGDWDDVQSSMQHTSPFRKSPLLTISDRYEEITSTWYGYTKNDGESNFRFDDYVAPKPEPIRVEKKIGRNDPCLCGSGKKYKKCCLN